MHFALLGRQCAAAMFLLVCGTPLCAQFGSYSSLRVDEPDGVPRFRMQATIREQLDYAAELPKGQPPVSLWDPRSDERITPATLPVVALSPHQRESFALAEKALGLAAPGEFYEAPLTQVVEELKKASGCPIVIDEKALADAAIGTDTLISLSLSNSNLRNVLNQICTPHALAWKVKAPGLVITTQEQADTNPDYRDVVIYPARDLIDDGSGEYDFDTLIDLITSMVHPETWKDTGTGEGTIAPAPSVAGIVVCTTREVHDEIFATMLALRQTRSRQHLDVLVPRRSAARALSEAPNDPGRYDWKPRLNSRKRTYWSAGNQSPSPPPSLGGGFF
jgi:hypothetical protein